MKHPFWDRLLILLCAAVAVCGAVGSLALVLGKLSLVPVIELLTRISLLSLKSRIALVVLAIVLALFALLLIAVTLPAAKKRSSSFAIQQNENGMVRISLKALETLVHKCLDQHAELKVVTSSLYSDEESIRVDVHVTLQSDISMPLAISALQKQIKRYLEACSGVVVQEVRVFVDGAMPSNEDTAKSPYAIPAALLGLEQEALPGAAGLQSAPSESELVSEEREAADVANEAGKPEAEIPAGEENAAEETADVQAQEPVQEDQGEDA